MKVLLDTCMSGSLLVPLADAGHEVVWSGAWAVDPGDDEILSIAYREGRVLVTLDKDFGMMAVLHGKPHVGIVRLVNMSLKEQTAVCLHILQTYGADLTSGAIITAEQGRLRIRMPE
jgi:predicted nuclease of predicted toxin-antitoxin system